LTWLDWFIGGAFVFFIFLGYRKGFVQQFFDLLGSVLALILAFYFYQRLGTYLENFLHFSSQLCSIIGFVLIVVLINGSVSFIGKRWKAAQKNEPITLIDGGIGALFGGFKAAVIIIIILLTLMALPWDFVRSPIETSSFANDLLRLGPLFYVLQDQSLPLNMPRLVVSPEGLQIRNVKDKELSGTTCVACGHKVEYRGLVKEGLSSYPQTYCPFCHRISDGCLTFEGFHMLNGVCPYERFGSVGVTDCKVWPNPESTSIKGKCPVCGRTE
jgi:uncharacterized membrane protein required for colicin V production